MVLNIESIFPCIKVHNWKKSMFSCLSCEEILILQCTNISGLKEQALSVFLCQAGDWSLDLQSIHNYHLEGCWKASLQIDHHLLGSKFCLHSKCSKCDFCWVAESQISMLLYDLLEKKCSNSHLSIQQSHEFHLLCPNNNKRFIVSAY